MQKHVGYWIYFTKKIFLWQHDEHCWRQELTKNRLKTNVFRRLYKYTVYYFILTILKE